MENIQKRRNLFFKLTQTKLTEINVTTKVIINKA